MAKEPHQKTNAELAQDFSTRPDSLIHSPQRPKCTKSRRTGPVAELGHVRFRGDRSARATASPARLTSPISVRSISENVRTPLDGV